MTLMKYSVNSLQDAFSLLQQLEAQPTAKEPNAYSEAFTNFDLLSGLSLKQSSHWKPKRQNYFGNAES